MQSLGNPKTLMFHLPREIKNRGVENRDCDFDNQSESHDFPKSFCGNKSSENFAVGKSWNREQADGGEKNGVASLRNYC